MPTTARRLFQFLGASKTDEADETGSEVSAEPMDAELPAALSASEIANERLIDQIADFMKANRLSATLRNLRNAHAACSGDEPHLARAIAQRLASGEPVSDEWLDAQTG